MRRPSICSRAELSHFHNELLQKVYYPHFKSSLLLQQCTATSTTYIYSSTYYIDRHTYIIIIIIYVSAQGIKAHIAKGLDQIFCNHKNNNIFLQQYIARELTLRSSDLIHYISTPIQQYRFEKNVDFHRGKMILFLTFLD